MNANRWFIRSQCVVLPDGTRPATIEVAGDRIAGIHDVHYTASELKCEEVGNLVIAPGVVDAHVHINEPGRTEWEGFATATWAAAAGGVTTLVDMPLNSSPVTTTAAALEAKREAAKGKCNVDVAFYGGLAGNVDQIDALIDAGVVGIKAFLCDSGLTEFPATSANEIDAIGRILARRQCPLLVHAELPPANAATLTNAKKYSDYLASRPESWETNAIELLLRLCRKHHFPLHIVHLANANALPTLAAAKREGLPVTVETCPHYLHFAAGEIADGDTRFKCAPPIREALHREALWQGLRDGILDTIGSDHSPCPPAMKCLETGNFAHAWGGIASLQLTLPVVWTNALKRGFALGDVFSWLSMRPANLVGLNDRGRLEAGLRADFVIFDPLAQWVVDGCQLHHRHQVTPYEGELLNGRVVRTYFGGKLVFSLQA